MKTTAVAAALTLAFLAPAAAAQSIYKYVYPDGRVAYSDQPVPGARLEEELERAPPPDPAAAAAARAKRLERAKAVDQAAAQRTRTLDQASDDLKFWSQKLEEAKARLEAGREPRPGERTGTVYQGKSQLNDEYWARQLDNEDAVAEAQVRVEQARAAIRSTR